MNNAFFKVSDKKADTIAGLPIHKEWWSRCYEYPWAIQYTNKKYSTADMGSGKNYRPFHEALAKRSKSVYAVDAGMLSFLPKAGVNYIKADFTREVVFIPDNSVDRVFCISVLEHLGDGLVDALKEFKRIMTEDGLTILTVDMVYDVFIPTPIYPGINLSLLGTAVLKSGLEFVGDVDTSKDNAVFNKNFNLCVFHCVLK